MEGLRDRVQEAASDVALGRAADRGLAIGLNVLLMRLLSPEPFGTIAMAAIVLGLLRPVVALGLPDAIRQFDELETGDVDTAFWLYAGAGLAAALLVVPFAGLMEAFFEQPGLAGVLAVMAVSLVARPLSEVPKGLFERDLRFGPVVLAELSATTLCGAAAVALAAAGAGVWSLVVTPVAGPVVEGVVLLGRGRWRPGRNVTRESAGRLLEYGRPLSQLGVLTFLNRKADDLLVGKLLGTEALGLYDRSYRLMLRPLDAPTAVVTRVLFPTGSRLQGATDQARRAYAEAIELLTFFVLPTVGFVFGAAPAIVPAVFGTQWTEMVPLVSILCAAAVPQTVVKPLGVVYRAEGRTRLFFRWNLIVTAVTVSAFALGAWLGTVEAVAWAYTASVYLVTYPQIRIPASIIDARPGELVRGAGGPVLGALVGAAGVRAAWHLSDQAAGHPWAFLGVAALSMAGLYAAVLRVVSRETLVDGLSVMRGLVARVADL